MAIGFSFAVIFLGLATLPVIGTVLFVLNERRRRPPRGRLLLLIPLCALAYLLLLGCSLVLLYCSTEEVWQVQMAPWAVVLGGAAVTLVLLLIVRAAPPGPHGRR